MSSIYTECGRCRGEGCAACRYRGIVLGENRPDYPEDVDENEPDPEELSQ